MGLFVMPIVLKNIVDGIYIGVMPDWKLVSYCPLHR